MGLLPFYSIFLMDSLFYWNTRGACDSGLLRNLKVVCDGPKPIFIGLAETRCERETRFRCLASLGFDGIGVSPSNGRSGGLVIAWKSAQIQISIIEQDRQFFHVLCEIPDRQTFMMTVVYVSPNIESRTQIWEKLKIISSSSSLPWIVMGDFNDILEATDRTGGARICHNRINWFQDRVSECGLVDMGFKGPKFTWRGPLRPGCSRLYERLDRALCNSNFLTTFPDSFLKVLPRTKFSDHNPISL
ncbi:uncharacterized protein LOC114754555 [Neltuma alba]|uniref:uncharacterized protein LOC114754555 n=1 Tax=Neltuma alba TaxID=207710 RepID=UPI0010A59871|nr:uncharacterized protein LOC114754555 [Prosopis alba]